MRKGLTPNTETTVRIGSPGLVEDREKLTFRHLSLAENAFQSSTDSLFEVFDVNFSAMSATHKPIEHGRLALPLERWKKIGLLAKSKNSLIVFIKVSKKSCV